MARIAGVDLPAAKRLVVALTYLYGIGPNSSQRICEATGVSAEKRVKDLTEEENTRLRNEIEANYRIEGTLRTEVTMNVKRLMDIGCYRGLRHRRNLPAHGQRTKTNARTRKGPKKGAIPNKKKA